MGRSGQGNGGLPQAGGLRWVQAGLARPAYGRVALEAGEAVGPHVGVAGQVLRGGVQDRQSPGLSVVGQEGEPVDDVRLRMRGQRRAGDAGVGQQRADRAAPGVQASLQLQRKQHDGELGSLVGAHPVVRAGTPIDVVEVQPALPVQLTGHRHHPVAQPRQQHTRRHGSAPIETRRHEPFRNSRAPAEHHGPTMREKHGTTQDANKAAIRVSAGHGLIMLCARRDSNPEPSGP